MKRSVTCLVVTAIVAGAVITVGDVAEAVRVPRTLAHVAPVGAAPVTPGFPIDYVGVQWDGDASGGAIRFQHGAQWSAWAELTGDGVEVAGTYASGLVWGADATAYQLRLPVGAARPRAVAINTTDGPAVTIGEGPGDAAGAALSVIRRSQWGADESLRFTASGNEIWPPTYYPAQKLTVHHTATLNGDPDPAATLRAIYRYHAVDRGFGDIGYQYLIDEAGRTYEGRWSGTDPDPGHDATGLVVTAAHVGGYNSGNVGAALLGTLTTQGPFAAARSALESLLADLASRHGLDPMGSSTFTNPVSGAKRDGPNISGHRDWEATECPGGALYLVLPTIRSNVAALMSPTTTTTASSSTTTTTSSTTTTTSSTTTTTLPADTRPPVISSVGVFNVTAKSATIRWSTDETSTSRVEYWATGSSKVLTVLDGALVTGHDIAMSRLTRQTNYSYRVSSTDASGNTATGAIFSFTTRK